MLNGWQTVSMLGNFGSKIINQGATGGNGSTGWNTVVGLGNQNSSIINQGPTGGNGSTGWNTVVGLGNQNSSIINQGPTGGSGSTSWNTVNSLGNAASNIFDRNSLQPGPSYDSWAAPYCGQNTGSSMIFAGSFATRDSVGSFAGIYQIANQGFNIIG